MPDLDLPYGPWTRIVSAQWQEYPVALYSNPDKVLLLVVFEKSGGRIDGMLVTLRKVFLADPQVAKALSMQKKEATSITKYSQASRTDFSYLIVGTAPAYSNYSQEDLLSVISTQFNLLHGISSVAEQAAEGYHLKLKELRDSSDEEIQELLGDPFTIFSLLHPSSSVRDSALKTSVEVPLGSQAEGGIVRFPIDLLKVTEVVGAPKERRLHFLHLIAEAALTNSVPCVVFDYSNAFEGLSRPNPDTRNFTKFGLTAMPLGFPYKAYSLGKGLLVDLQYLEAGEFTDAFGLVETDVGSTITKAWAILPDKHFLSDLSAAVSSLKEAKEIGQYLLAKTLRALKVIDRVSPSMFGKNPESDLLVPWRDGVGRVFHIKLNPAFEQCSSLLMSSLLRSMPIPRGQGSRVLFVFEPDASRIPTWVLQRMKEDSDMEASFALNAEHVLDFSVVDAPTLRVDLIENEMVANAVDRKPIRFTPRPALTSCTEIPSPSPKQDSMKPLLPPPAPTRLN